VLTIESPGGGGFGDPLERPRETVLRDIEEGYVTAWPKAGDATNLNKLEGPDAN
jgi:N-methylhydantoinase B/oxoprolinase/acetone carboxylase alpha subunit